MRARLDGLSDEPRPGRPRTITDDHVSKDPFFVAEVRDVVGLYLEPPAKAVVLCVDEKTQIQALDRSAPVLPMLPGVPQRQSFDYVRHGTTSLFAALAVATGQVISAVKRRHRHQEFLAFPHTIDRNVPAGQDIHVVLDNLSTPRPQR